MLIELFSATMLYTLDRNTSSNLHRIFKKKLTLNMIIKSIPKKNKLAITMLNNI